MRPIALRVVGVLCGALAVACAPRPKVRAGAATAEGSRANVVVQWSHPDHDRTPSELAFHGPFVNETVTASAEWLPPHDLLEIDVDLLLLRSWDGSVPIPAHGPRSPDGPDYLRVGLLGGPTLLDAAFSNLPPDDPSFYAHSKTQNFPSQVPGDRFRPMTGATLRNALGYNFPWPGPPQLVPMDAVYHLRFIVPHSESRVAVQLTAAGLSDLPDESWGVRHLTVRPLAAGDVPVPDVDAIAKAFATSLDVAGTDQANAFTTLTTGGDTTTQWVASHVKPQPVDGPTARQLLAALAGGDDRVAARDGAGRHLSALGPQAEVGLRDLRRDAAGEVRARCDGVLQRIGIDPIAAEDVRRVMLATRVLEVIATPEALALRHRLVGM